MAAVTGAATGVEIEAAIVGAKVVAADIVMIVAVAEAATVAVLNEEADTGAIEVMIAAAIVAVKVAVVDAAATRVDTINHPNGLIITRVALTLRVMEQWQERLGDSKADPHVEREGNYGRQPLCPQHLSTPRSRRRRLGLFPFRCWPLC